MRLILFIISILLFSNACGMFEEKNLAGKYLLASYAKKRQRKYEILVPLYEASSVYVSVHGETKRRLATWSFFSGVAVLMYFLYKNGDQFAILSHDLLPKDAGRRLILELEKQEAVCNLAIDLASVDIVVVADPPHCSDKAYSAEHALLLKYVRQLQQCYALQSGAEIHSLVVDKFLTYGSKGLSVVMQPGEKKHIFYFDDLRTQQK